MDNLTFEQSLEKLTYQINKLAEATTTNQEKTDIALQILAGQNIANMHPAAKRRRGMKHSLGPVASEADHNPLSDNAFWQDCALDRTVINALVHPMSACFNDIPSFPSIHKKHSYAALSGNVVRRTDGQNPPADDCDDCRTLEHSWSACKISYPMGRLCARTKTLETNELLARACHRLYDDFMLVGDLGHLIPGTRPFMEALNDADDSFFITAAVRRKFWEIGKYFQETDADWFWSGNPIGGQSDALPYWGLYSIIRADWHTAGVPNRPMTEFGGDGVDLNLDQGACGVFNAEIKDFNGNCIGGDVNILYWLESVEHNLWTHAMKTGAGDDVEWKLVMSSAHWAELSRWMPCLKAGLGCGQTPEGDIVRLDGATIVAERDRMHETGSIILNGRVYPVEIDDYMPYTIENVPPTEDCEGQVCYTADINFVNTYAYGRPTLFYQHMDYSELGNVLQPLDDSPWGRQMGWHDGGRFRSTIEMKNWCFQLQSKMQKRLVHIAPHLNGRLMNVKACHIQETPMGVLPGQPIGTPWYREGVSATAPDPSA